MTTTETASTGVVIDCYISCFDQLQNYITVLEEIEDIPDAAQADVVKTDDSASGCQASPTGTSGVVKEVKLVSLDDGNDDSNGTVTPCLPNTASRQSVREVSLNSIDERLDTSSPEDIHSVKSPVTLFSSPVHSVPAPCIQE